MGAIAVNAGCSCFEIEANGSAEFTAIQAQLPIPKHEKSLETLMFQGFLFGAVDGT